MLVVGLKSAVAESVKDCYWLCAVLCSYVS